MARYSIDSKETKVLIDSEEKDGKDAIYADNDLYLGVFWPSPTEVSFKALDRARVVMVTVNTQTGERKQLFLYDDFESEMFLRVLATHKDYLVVNQNNFYYTGRVGIVPNWQQYKDGEKAIFVWEEGIEKCLKGEVEEIKVAYKDVTGFLWRLKEGTWEEKGAKVELSKRPLIVSLHGGPHGAWGALNDPCQTVLLELGYQILTVNFSGSWSLDRSVV